MTSLCLTVFLCAFNVIQVLSASVLGGVAIWSFIEVVSLTSLRNPIHYQLKQTLNWPEVLPWVFLMAAILTILTDICGLCGSKRKSRPLILLYVVLQMMSILLLVGAPLVALTLAEGPNTAEFFKSTMWDVFYTSIDSQDGAYNSFEERLRCCGVSSPRDYVPKRNNFPASCCYSGKPCDFSDHFANKLSGCNGVVDKYTEYFIKGMSVGSVVVAIVGVIGFLIAVVLSMKMKTKKLEPAVETEADCQKVLL
ncbi:uncharacterized protein LOC101736223 [Bombyx mori]|uniref:Tetraspanin n=1 Tax=Bombyx mori TaxID=7091 RepID=A0A8R2AJB1_BOMMO|nr:uncharacterized protein LOC101736223 [Bombyx mori]